MFMKLTMGTSVTGSNLLRTKLDYVFVRLMCLNVDISFKLNEELYKFLKLSN